MFSTTSLVILIAIILAPIWVFLHSNSRPPYILKDDITKKYYVTRDVRIAVIGSGIGGASAAYFIRMHLGPKAEIHVYEKSNKVGGRLAIENFDNHWFESGGSIIHSSNKYMTKFVETLGLEKRPQLDEGNDKFGIYNGHEFVFIESLNGLVSKLKLIFRYGLMPLIYLQKSLSYLLNRFENIYKLQDGGQAFTSVEDMLNGMGDLFSYTQSDAKDLMLKKGLSERLIDELVTGVTRNNYGQSSHVNAFTGYVSLAGAQGGELYSVKGGNYLVPKALLAHSEAKLFTNRLATSIDKQMCNSKVCYHVDTTHFKGSSVETDNERSVNEGDYAAQTYDIVIVAVPLEVKDDFLECKKCSNWPQQSKLGAYQRTVATFVKGEINYKHFHYNEGGLSDIFTMESKDIPFNSIGKQTNVTGSTPNPSIYKVFSRLPLSDGTLQNLFIFNSTVQKQVKSWLAYPHYTPPEKFLSFLLDDGVFYVNAIERAASAMEMSALGGRNAALLTKDYFNGGIQK